MRAHVCGLQPDIVVREPPAANRCLTRQFVGVNHPPVTECPLVGTPTTLTAVRGPEVTTGTTHPRYVRRDRYGRIDISNEIVNHRRDPRIVDPHVLIRQHRHRLHRHGDATICSPAPAQLKTPAVRTRSTDRTFRQDSLSRVGGEGFFGPRLDVMRRLRTISERMLLYRELLNSRGVVKCCRMRRLIIPCYWRVVSGRICCRPGTHVNLRDRARQSYALDRLWNGRELDLVLGEGCNRWKVPRQFTDLDRSNVTDSGLSRRREWSRYLRSNRRNRSDRLGRLATAHHAIVEQSGRAALAEIGGLPGSVSLARLQNRGARVLGQK
ncbi:MAG: hypothetical protein QOF01_3224 [Thermomicrobiales bacterium]|nr:hypothetical protein [Thermomicrobiales bacterium]